ncbi:hypothetical protein MLD38_020199 [Melastoma candidum]|uniref:Uncharacterized protein n=1 Tax=Melastoma candidum TaxID=119954 RepID=A0ACB9QF61_9MYRT|nr:hypothetical protein MLD38_020199 [Melastoma candidum]
MEHLRMNGAYWGLTTIDLLGRIDAVDVNAIVSWIMACQHESGGFGGNVGHDPHVLYTLSAVQCLALFDKMHLLDVEKMLPSYKMRMYPSLETNGVKLTPVFCCVGALAITGHLDRVDKDLLGWWLCERQVCYSWWVLSSLTMIGRVRWIDREKLIEFILNCQDTERAAFLIGRMMRSIYVTHTSEWRGRGRDSTSAASPFLCFVFFSVFHLLEPKPNTRKGDQARLPPTNSLFPPRPSPSPPPPPPPPPLVSVPLLLLPPAPYSVRDATLTASPYASPPPVLNGSDKPLTDRMEWGEKEARDGVRENGFLKVAAKPLSSAAATTSAAIASVSVSQPLVVKALEGKDGLSYANILRSRNKFVDALRLYESILEEDKANVNAYIGKGICLQMQNMGRLAFDSFAEAIKLDPQNACALTHCGILYKDEGRLLEAAESYQKALRADPSYKQAAESLAIVLTDIGTSLKLGGNTQEGIQKYYEALKIDPRYAPAYYNLGVVYSEMMQYDTALNCYEKAAMERPMYAEAYCNMGVIYKNRGDLEAAIACYERCLAVSPNFDIAKNNMAIALTDLGTKVKLEGDITQGVAYYKKALYYNWHYADAMYNLGVAYGEMLKFDMAIVFYELAFHFNPHCAEACNNLGVIYKDRDNLDKAVECYELALSIKPNFSQSLNNLGVVYTVQGKMDAAANMIQKAIIANPTYSEAYNNLGVLYRDAGNISAAIVAYEQCLKIDPDSRNAGQNRLLALNYINEGGDDKLFEAHRDWGRRFMRLFPQYTSWDNPKHSEKPLVIGYVSPDYFTHSVSYFIEAPLTYHDYENFRVVVYSAVVKADAKTIRFRDKVLKNGGIWRDIYGLDEKKIASVVREDKVDILVELTGHTANNKLGTMACRPAPVQVTWIGYPNTTGLPTIDYRITDSLADPPDSKQKHVEELVRLPECFLCYTPSSEAGPVCATPALSNGFVTFGSFNNLAKITPKVMQVWARILCAVPNSRLVVKCKPFCCDSVRQTILSTLEQLGMEPLRVDLLPLILLNHDHMQAYSLMDISLDTFPYAGTTTTCESLYMGVPCITMAGSVHAHNVGVSLLTKVGLGHLIAKDEDEYVDLAIKLASDVAALSTLRMGLRERMSKSPLCDGQKFTTGLESAYRNMWRRYCNGDVPALKHLEMLKRDADSEAPDLPNASTILATADAPHGSRKENGFFEVSHGFADVDQTVLEVCILTFLCKSKAASSGIEKSAGLKIDMIELVLNGIDSMQERFVFPFLTPT